MFSRFLLISSIAVVLGCGLKVGEEAAPQAVVKAQSADCLDQSIAHFKSMYAGTLDDAQVSPAIHCLAHTIDEFNLNVQGQNKNYFTPHELVQFINKKVLKDKTSISLSLATEVMKLKVTFLGGDNHFMTKSELRSLTQNMRDLTPDFVTLNRYFRFKQKSDYAAFDLMEKEFNLAASHLSDKIQGGYNLNDLKNLFQQLIDAKIVENPNFIRDFHKYHQLLVSSYQLATSIERTEIFATEVKSLIQLASRSYFHFLEYQNYLQPLPYQNESFAPQILNWLPKVKETLEDALKINSQGYMSTENFISTYQVICKELGIEIQLTESTWELILKLLWSNILNPAESRLKGTVLPGFNQTALDQAYMHLHLLWSADIQAGQMLTLQRSPNPAQLQKLFQQQMAVTTDSKDQQILKEMKAVFSGPVPFSLKNNFLKILDPESNQYHYPDLQFSNIARVATRLITSSFSTSLKRINDIDQLQSQMTLGELQDAFNQIKVVLIELDLLTPNTETFMSSRFREANLFMPRSNGDQWMSYMETHDLALHLISGTLRAAKIRPSITQYCLPSIIKVTSSVEIDETCLLDTYFKLNTGFEYLPQYGALKLQASPEQNKEHTLNLLVAGGYVFNSKNKVLMEDADRFPHIVQYVEMMYAIFDTNNDGSFVKDEALRAFPLYKDLIKKALGSISGGDSVTEEQMPGVFIYFLKYGRAPESLWEKIQFKIFIANEKKWVINSSRFDIGKVFKSLNAY